MPNTILSVVLKALADRVEHLELIAARCGLSVEQVRDAIGGLRAKGYPIKNVAPYTFRLMPGGPATTT